MSSQLENLMQRIRDLQAELEAEIEERRKEFRYRLERNRVVFEEDVRARHRAARERLSSFLAKTRLTVVLTAPFIYALIIPLVLLDLFVSVYQAVCFPVYDIPKVPRRDFIAIDRQNLEYLNKLQKLNCIYCGYANGLIGWVREIASRTEAYWCPIKHSRRMADNHVLYTGFIEFGDEKDFERKVMDQRRALKTSQVRTAD